MVNKFEPTMQTSAEEDILVIGSGPAATALAEVMSRRQQKKYRIILLERGPLALPTHFNNLLPNSLRRQYINQFGKNPWTGDMSGGMQMNLIGGRGVVAGANRVQFYREDFTCFDKGVWPKCIELALPELYAEVQRNHRIGDGDINCEAQDWAKRSLRDLGPVPPQIAFDKGSPGFVAPRGYDSSVSRLAAMLVEESMLPSNERRLLLVSDCYVTRISHDRGRATGILCVNSTDPSATPHPLPAAAVILAASPIGSAHLALNSGLDVGLRAVGRFLAEHTERRAKIRITLPWEIGPNDGISLVLPPPGSDPKDRYQLHLRGQADLSNKRGMVVDIGAFGAVDPCPENRVTLGTNCDEFGVPRAHITYSLNANDKNRARAMCTQIENVVAALGGEFATDEFPLELGKPMYTDQSRRIEVMAPGRSYHEAGTLRMGSDSSESVCDTSGRLFGFENLYVADASLYPCVGVANPILTTSALAYWVAKNIIGTMV